MNSDRRFKIREPRFKVGDIVSNGNETDILIDFIGIDFYGYPFYMLRFKNEDVECFTDNAEECPLFLQNI